MFPVIFLLLALSPVNLAAEIYRSVDADGRLQFSDRPESRSELLDSSRFSTPPASEPDSGREGRFTGPYKAFEVVAPQPNQTIRKTEEMIEVSLLLDPPLIEGQRLQMILDSGTPIPLDRKTGTQFALGQVKFGSHKTYAEVVDARGTVLARTAEISFHLQKPTPPGVLK